MNEKIKLNNFISKNKTNKELIFLKIKNLFEFPMKNISNIN